ncbi:hypothetical protein GCM10028808_57750 [Spirosoma migulaei]
MAISHKREFERLIHNSSLKREELLNIAAKRARRRKYYNVAAGTLSLFAAATITSIITDLTYTLAAKLFAAILSTASAIISLLLSVEPKDSEISDCYAGATRYLTLRERANLNLLRPEINPAQTLQTLEELQSIYTDLDMRYMGLINDHSFAREYSKRKFHIGKIGSGKSFGPDFLKSYRQYLINKERAEDELEESD